MGEGEAKAGAGSFAHDSAVIGLLETLNAAPDVFTAKTPRKLRAAARNELRRNIRGLVKVTDVKVPLCDGSYVYADVFRPAGDGQYPIVLNKGFYGESAYHECICNEGEAQAREGIGDRYFPGNPDGLQYENHESVDASVWVPHGNACVRVDARGVWKSPGQQAPFSLQEAEDYYDTIEWAGTQPWSNGNVGLWGMSYLAMTRHNVASLQPPHLKVMIAQGTDADIYNEALYDGGIFGSGFWNWWWKIWSGRNFCGERRETDWMARALATPFNDPSAYGPHGSIFMVPDLEKATAPVWIVGPRTGAIIRQLGSSETFIHSKASKSRKFEFVDAWFPDCYKDATAAEHIRYFDHWLKGIDNGAMDGAPVRVEVRTGNGAHFILEDTDWAFSLMAGMSIGLAQGALDRFLERSTGRPIRGTTYKNQLEAPLTHLMLAEVHSKIPVGVADGARARLGDRPARCPRGRRYAGRTGVHAEVQREGARRDGLLRQMVRRGDRAHPAELRLDRDHGERVDPGGLARRSGGHPARRAQPRGAVGELRAADGRAPAA